MVRLCLVSVPMKLVNFATEVSARDLAAVALANTVACAVHLSDSLYTCL